MSEAELRQSILENAKNKTPAPVLIDSIIASTKQSLADVRRMVRKMVMSGDLVLTDDRKVKAR